MSSRPTGIDLFAGAGGMSLGFEQAGFDIIAAVEIDPIHCAIHEYNFPSTTMICSDISKVSSNQLVNIALEKGKEQIDVIFGGAPCQGFSLIGKRALDDPRNSLVKEFVRIVSEVKPKYFVFENVKGLTVGKHKKVLAELIESMEAAGYEVIKPVQVLNAANYGVPQDRQRVFVIGALKSLPLPKYPEPEYDLDANKIEGHIKSTPTVSCALMDLPNADDFDELEYSDSVKCSYGTPSDYVRRLNGLIPDKNNYGFKRSWDSELMTCSLRTEHGKESKKRFAKTEAGKTEPISRFKKLDPKGVCNTLRAGTGSDKGAFTSPRPIHPVYARCITVREAARLHSYPDWFRFHATKWHGFRQIGNSVPPLLARAVATEVREALGVNVGKPRKTLKLGNQELLTIKMSGAADRFSVPSDVVGRRLRETANA